MRYFSSITRVILSLSIVMSVFCGPGLAYSEEKGGSGFADIVERLTPAVVNIATEQKEKVRAPSNRGGAPSLPGGSFFDEFRRFFERMEPYGEENQRRDVTFLGSGFIIDKSGVIVTNNHVIANASSIAVTLSDNRRYKAKVLGKDPRMDIAVLKISNPDGREFASVQLGDSEKSRVGDWVIAIGNPFGLGGSVSVGIVSARSRDLNTETSNEFIQTDAAINRGNSGGPLFDANGNVIGINTAIFSPGASGGNVGIGFAIPISSVKRIISTLAEGKKVSHGWLGVSVQAVNEEVADSLGLKEVAGALVGDVVKKGPADQSGIKVGDVILEFDGKKILRMTQLPHIVALTEVGKKVDVVVYRNGKIVNMKMRVVNMPDNFAAALDKDSMDSDSISVELLGLFVANVSDELKKAYRIDNDLQSGVVVVGVDDGSDAAIRGLKKGDIITSINQESVSDVADFEAKLLAIKNERMPTADSDKFALLYVVRDRTGIFMPVKIKE